LEDLLQEARQVEEDSLLAEPLDTSQVLLDSRQAKPDQQDSQQEVLLELPVLPEEQEQRVQEVSFIYWRIRPTKLSKCKSLIPINSGRSSRSQVREEGSIQESLCFWSQ
jgi:hypothetical protein